MPVPLHRRSGGQTAQSADLFCRHFHKAGHARMLQQAAATARKRLATPRCHAALMSDSDVDLLCAAALSTRDGGNLFNLADAGGNACRVQAVMT